MRSFLFYLVSILVGGLFFAFARWLGNDYLFFAGYTVLQFIVLATAWNILGGYCGYVNFGSAAFFALGAYSSVGGVSQARRQRRPLFPGTAGRVGESHPAAEHSDAHHSWRHRLGPGRTRHRLSDLYGCAAPSFAIATLALAVVLQTLIVNWDFVGGSRGAYIIRPGEVPILGSYIQYLFLVMLVLSVVALATARIIEQSRLGYGFATIRDDEVAAEACGVPTLRLKLIATTISGALMGMAGAPFPYYIGYLEPSSAFGLAYAVNSIAMPMIGGTTSWVGPLVGALLLGTLQQVATVTISSAVNLLIVGLLLVGFVIVAPKGIIGLVQDFMRERASDKGQPTWRSRLAIFANMRPGAR